MSCFIFPPSVFSSVPLLLSLPRSLLLLHSFTFPSFLFVSFAVSSFIFPPSVSPSFLLLLSLFRSFPLPSSFPMFLSLLRHVLSFYFPFPVCLRHSLSFSIPSPFFSSPVLFSFYLSSHASLLFFPFKVRAQEYVCLLRSVRHGGGDLRSLRRDLHPVPCAAVHHCLPLRRAHGHQLRPG